MPDKSLRLSGLLALALLRDEDDYQYTEKENDWLRAVLEEAIDADCDLPPPRVEGSLATPDPPVQPSPERPQDSEELKKEVKKVTDDDVMEFL